MVISRRYREADVVRITLVVIFLSLIIIYVAYFHLENFSFDLSSQQEQTQDQQAQNLMQNQDQSQIQSQSQFQSQDIVENQDQDQNQTGAVSSGIQVEVLSGGVIATGSEAVETGVQSEQIFDAMSILDDIGSGGSAESDFINGENIENTENTEDMESVESREDIQQSVSTQTTEASTISDIIVFSGTKEFFGNIEATQILGLDYKYILTDDEAYYVYLGTGEYDFATVARSLGGNIVEIVTEIDIVKNDLFGEKIAFVNIPSVTYTSIPVEQRITVFMIVWYNNDRRLIQADYASYHRLKSIMKQRFVSYYEQ